MHYSLAFSTLVVLAYSFPYEGHVCPTGLHLDEYGLCVPYSSTSPPPTPTPTECPTGTKKGLDGVCTPFGAPTDICTGGKSWYDGKCVCPPGSRDDGQGDCKPFYCTTCIDSTPTPPPTTPTPPPTTPTPPPTPIPWPCKGNVTAPNCAIPPPPGPTGITTTTTEVETITFCPKSTTCTGQTVTWTATEGPTSCPPVVTCTCILPGGPPKTLTTCPPSVTCSGQTTTNPAGQTIVLPSETLNLPPKPTSTASTPPLEGIAVKGGVGLVAMLLGAIAYL